MTRQLFFQEVKIDMLCTRSLTINGGISPAILNNVIGLVRKNSKYLIAEEYLQNNVYVGNVGMRMV